MKKILLCLGLIISTYAFVSAQANLFKNSHFEEQGAWLIVQQNPDSIVPYVFLIILFCVSSFLLFTLGSFFFILIRLLFLLFVCFSLMLF